MDGEWITISEPAPEQTLATKVIVTLEALDEFVRRHEGLLARIEKKLGPTTDADYLSIKLAAKTAAISESHVRRAINSSELPASNVGSTLRPAWRIARKDLIEWMDKKKGGTMKVPPKSELKEAIKRHRLDV